MAAPSNTVRLIVRATAGGAARCRGIASGVVAGSRSSAAATPRT
jgi:hypothetical protein